MRKDKISVTQLAALLLINMEPKTKSEVKAMLAAIIKAIHKAIYSGVKFVPIIGIPTASTVPIARSIAVTFAITHTVRFARYTVPLL